MRRRSCRKKRGRKPCANGEAGEQEEGSKQALSVELLHRLPRRDKQRKELYECLKY